jgi:hypothetical protein
LPRDTARAGRVAYRRFSFLVTLRAVLDGFTRSN